MIWHHRWIERTHSRTHPRRPWRPGLVELERRELPAASPFGAEFQQRFQNLLTTYDFPQGSIALVRDGESFTYGATNSGYFGRGPTPAAPSADTLFRIGSVSKTLTAMAILKLVQDGQLDLDDSVLDVLNYKPGETIAGFDPITGASVSVALDKDLFNIKVVNLLQMTSGLQYNIPLASAAFRYEPPGNLTAKEGSYAALGFAGVPPGSSTYDAPATMPQLIRYMLFELSENPGLANPPGRVTSTTT